MSYQEQTTLMTVANRLAIGDLTARYNRALEAGDLEMWIGTFVQEGVLRGTGGESFSGHRELIGFFRAAPPGRIRLTTDAQVDVDGVHARQECRFLTLRRSSNGGGPVVEAVGRYHDALTYERGRWYFAAREMVADLGPAP
ncbi:MAG: nuclear transport factor 2 family protein [Acidimicrobiales bacterium]